jgi:glycosyltransferase involved in cell wall biosynthesis
MHSNYHPKPRAQDPRRLRVLTLVDSSRGLGGGELIAARVAMLLNPSRFDRILCWTRPSSGSVADQLSEAGVCVLSLERRSRAALQAWLPLISLVRRERVDIIHAHKFGSNIWGTLIGRMTRVPVILAHEHSWSYEGDPLRRFLDREVVARWADAIVAVSREDRRRMIEIERIDPSKVRFIPNGIPSLPLFEGRRARRELGIAVDAPVIGSVGGLRPPKALDVLIEAVALIAPQFPRLHLLIVGEGPDEATLKKLIRARNLGQTVRLLGARKDVPRILAALDLAVLSSDSEGSPLSVMEYMAAGKPVVATRVGGIPDLIDHGVEGLLVERRNARSLADALTELLNDSDRAAEMGARAYDRHRRQFDIGVMVGRLELLYEELFWATPRGRAEARLPCTSPGW